MGELGLRRIAALNHQAACETADAISTIDGVELATSAFFNEFTLRLPRNATDIVNELAVMGVLAGVPGERLWPSDPAAKNLLIVAATECVTREDIKAFATALREVVA